MLDCYSCVPPGPVVSAHLCIHGSMVDSVAVCHRPVRSLCSPVGTATCTSRNSERNSASHGSCASADADRCVVIRHYPRSAVVRLRWWLDARGVGARFRPVRLSRRHSHYSGVTPMVFQHSGGRDFDLPRHSHYSGVTPMVFQHSVLKREATLNACSPDAAPPPARRLRGWV
jgi:hypothetical protein